MHNSKTNLFQYVLVQLISVYLSTDRIQQTIKDAQVALPRSAGAPAEGHLLGRSVKVSTKTKQGKTNVILSQIMVKGMSYGKRNQSYSNVGGAERNFGFG